MEGYTIVLALKLFTHNGNNNLERFMKVGMPTLEHFLDITGLLDFIVIAPRSDIATIKQELTTNFSRYPWRFVVEDVLVSKQVENGWAKQQTAKIAVAAMVKTDCYLIIDDDTYLTKPFGQQDLKYNNKYIMNKCDIDFPFFFLWSANALGADFDTVQNAPYHMAITPEIFHTQTVQSLIECLEQMHGTHMKWQEYLANNKFTEYCMYWTYLRNKNQHTELYACEEAGAPQLYGNPTSGQEHILTSQVEKSFKENTNYWFSFVQSSLPYTNSEVQQEVMRHV
jgi:hypothetical protein